MNQTLKSGKDDHALNSSVCHGHLYQVPKPTIPRARSTLQGFNETFFTLTRLRNFLRLRSKLILKKWHLQFESVVRMMDFTHKRVKQILTSILRVDDEDNIETNDENLSDEEQ